MYERFFQFRERPFSLTPDPDYLFPSRVHREALACLRHAFASASGTAVLTGEIGTGKTTLLQTALRTVDDSTAVARLISTQLGPRELLEAVILDFGIEPPLPDDTAQLIHVLADHLLRHRAHGRSALLVIDEAHNLAAASLQLLEMMTRLHTDGAPLLQIALIGQPPLRDLLARQELEPLARTIATVHHLRALDAAETADYIRHRLRFAALGTPLDFPDDVCALIHERSGGLPRTINVIADAVLLSGYAREQQHITAALTRSTLDELDESDLLDDRQASRLAAGGGMHRDRRDPFPAQDLRTHRLLHSKVAGE